MGGGGCCLSWGERRCDVDSPQIASPLERSYELLCCWFCLIAGGAAIDVPFGDDIGGITGMDIQNTDTGIGLMWRGCNRCISERYRGPAGMISSSASTSRTAGLLGWDGMGCTDEDAVNDILGQIQTLAMKEYPRDLLFLFRGFCCCCYLMMIGLNGPIQVMGQK
eukprot:scaffold51798_cov57-Attheya_sp.AAC.3